MPFRVTLHDELITEYAFDTDILVEGRRKHLVTRMAAESTLLPEETRPALALGVRVYADEDGAVRFCPAVDGIALERRAISTTIRRTRRQVAVAGDVSLLWAILRLMDGRRTVASILAELPQSLVDPAAQLLAALTGAGVIDVSGRPFGRFLHEVTKNGVLPNGGLSPDDIRRLVTNGNYRAYPDRPRVPVRAEVPERLAPLYEITRSRRSPWGFVDRPLAGADFDALLTTGCGITGTLEWEGREVKLRAYPSGGGLYAVEIYPIVFSVEGLKPAVYHYRPAEMVLEVIRTGINRSLMLDAALPAQREILPGVAVMICLTGVFTRFERKYGEGSNRILAAEAGHIAQNLVLAATALGLHARPCGGFFDDLINQAIRVDTEHEQFLLSVLIGYA